jgi:hypothetical protein
MAKNVADVRTGLATAHREGAQSFIYNHGSHQKSISVVSVWPWPERPSPRRSRTGRSTHSDRSHRGLPEAFRRSTLSGYLSPVATIRQWRGRRTQFRGSPMKRGSGSPREVVPIRVATRSKVRTRRRSRTTPLYLDHVFAPLTASFSAPALPGLGLLPALTRRGCWRRSHLEVDLLLAY